MNHVSSIRIRIALCWVAILIGIVLHPQTVGGGVPVVFEDPPVPGRVIVRTTSDENLATFLDNFSGQYEDVAVSRSIDSRRIYLISYLLGSGQTLLEVQAFLDGQVGQGTLKWGELVYQGQAAEGKTDELWTAQIGVGTRQFEQQYSWNLIDVSLAQSKSRGGGTVIAVLDTGVDATHPLFEGAVKAQYGWNVLTDSDATFESLAAPPTDSDNDGLFNEMVGHGTFVAGLIHHMAPEASIMPVTVLDTNGVGDTFSIIAGMYYAIDHGVEVINMSLGSTYRMIGVEEAVAEAYGLGIIVVAAAGNFNVDDPRENPATISESIGVAATDSDDIKAPFSNYHPKLDLCAPGHSKKMAGNNSKFDPAKSIVGPVPNNGYAIWKGTSFSTPMVAAAAALIRSQHPEWSADAATSIQVLTALQAGSVDIYPKNPDYEDDESLGQGRLHVGNAVNAGPVAPQVGDLNADGIIDGGDLGILLSAWGAVHSSADLDGNGKVDGGDIGILLAAWS